MSTETTRREGHSRLVYNKERRTIEPADRKHITVVIGRHSLLALARGQEVHLNEVDASAVVTLIPESFFPSKAILAALEPDEGQVDE